MVTTIISSLFVAGGKGILQIPISGSTETRYMGHGYIAFFISIILATLVSGYFADIAAEWVKSNNTLEVAVMSNLILAGLVFIDFHVSFYER